MKSHCAAHSTPALAQCHACHRSLCEQCWQQNLDSHPHCTACIALKQRPWTALGVSGVTTAILLAISPQLFAWGWWSALVIGCILLAAWLLRRRNLRHAAAVRPVQRPHAKPPVPLPRLGVHPFRDIPFRLERQLRLPVSGATVAAGLLLVMTASAFILPRMLHLPRWLEFESVVALWWLTLSCVLTVLLYRGERISDDLPNSFDRKRGDKESWWDFSGFDAFEIEADWMLILAVAAGALIGTWLLAEFILPAVLFGLYLLVLTACRRALRDKHECERHVGKSLTWAIFWGSVFTAPLAAAGVIFKLV